MELAKQNVLFIGRATQQAGAENVVLQLCETLKPQVNNIVVCSADGFNKKALSELDIKFYPIPDIENKNLKNMLKIARTIKKIVAEEHITVIHTHHRMAAYYVALLRLYKRCVFINTSHNTFFNKKLLTRFAYKHAHLIACGEMVKKNLVDVYGLPDKQVTVIHNAVKSFDGEITVDPLIKKLHDQGCFIVGNVGRLSVQKGMEYFIKAVPDVVRTHPEARFVIAGSGEDEERLKKLSGELRVADYLTFLGYRTDVQNLMSQLDLVVLSSLWEGLPLTPIEAFSVGKTVVATAVDGTVEIVKDKENGLLVKPRDPEGLARQINWTIGNPERRKEMETRANERYREEFSFENLKQKCVSYYEELEPQ